MYEKIDEQCGSVELRLIQSEELANPLCGRQTKRTMRETEVQIENSGLGACLHVQPILL
jgi:hypothetical protein